MPKTDIITWHKIHSPVKWDKYLSKLGGHPLQSALWGDARRKVDGIEDFRWVALSDDDLIWMGRFEVRRIAKYFKVAWLPKGPTFPNHKLATLAHNQFIKKLRRNGFLIAIDDVYVSEDIHSLNKGVLIPPAPRTIWIDLSAGKEAILAKLHKQWRYGVRAAERAGVVVEHTRDPDDISSFYSHCMDISKKKGFYLPGSEPLMLELLTQQPGKSTEAKLFVARYNEKLGAGAVVLRCGKSIHYFWGATNREFSKQRVGEAVHWGIMEWAIDNELTKYDLEGIDPENNPGVCSFKRKMGGDEVSLAGKSVYTLNALGGVVFFIGSVMKKI